MKNFLFAAVVLTSSFAFAQAEPEISCLGSLKGTVELFDIQATRGAEFTGVLYPMGDKGDTLEMNCARKVDGDRKLIVCSSNAAANLYIVVESTPHGDFASLFEGTPFSQINSLGSLDCRPR